MAQSKQTIPHFYVSTEIVMDRVLDSARHLSARPGVPRVTATACLVRTLANALVEHPVFNAVSTPDGYVVAPSVNIGIAIALDAGLLAPALLDCQHMDLEQTSAALADLIDRAHTGHLRAPEVSSATFTLSNLGMFDVTQFTAIVIPPQAAILATGRAVRRPIAVGEEVRIASVMTATLSADHRVADGAQAARFLATLKSELEQFGEAPAATAR